MNKTKFLAFFAFSAMFFACGSQDGGPPELETPSVTISPFDTIVAKFNSDIVDIDKLKLDSNINAILVPSTKTTSRELRFIGKNTTPGGSHHFAGNVLNDSIVIDSLRNSDGYVKPRTVLYFSTYNILDNESNAVEDEANDIESLGDLTRDAGVTFAGVIDKIIGIDPLTSQEIMDRIDIYKLTLKAGNTISITVSSRATPFKVEFYGTCIDETKQCNNKSIDASQKSVVLEDTVKLGHFRENDFIGTKVPFYIKVSDGNMGTASNPYLITVKVK